jgi:hypothetical protein
MRHNNRKYYTRGAITSLCGEVKLRGTAQQIIDKYKVLANDADDSALKELYLQHAEHYTRTILAGRSTDEREGFNTTEYREFV